jgi:hypothetical protein
MAIMRIAVSLICAAVFATVGTQAAVADDPDWSVVTSKTKWFKATWSSADGTRYQDCKATLWEPHRKIGNNPVVARAKIECPHRIDSAGRVEFYFTGPNCNKGTGSEENRVVQYTNANWERDGPSQWDYIIRRECDDRPGLDNYSDGLQTSTVTIPEILDPDFRMTLLGEALA